MFADVCNSLKLKGPKHDISEAFEYSTLSCKQMSVLLRQWLLKDHNRKVHATLDKNLASNSI